MLCGLFLIDKLVINGALNRALNRRSFNGQPGDVSLNLSLVQTDTAASRQNFIKNKVTQKNNSTSVYRRLPPLNPRGERFGHQMIISTLFWPLHKYLSWLHGANLLHDGRHDYFAKDKKIPRTKAKHLMLPLRPIRPTSRVSSTPGFLRILDK